MRLGLIGRVEADEELLSHRALSGRNSWTFSGRSVAAGADHSHSWPLRVFGCSGPKLGLEYLDRSPKERSPQHTCLGPEATWRDCCRRSQLPGGPGRRAFSSISIARRKSRLASTYLPCSRSNPARLVVWVARRDDPRQEPFRRSRSLADKAARPRRTCPGPKQTGETVVSARNVGMILAENPFVDLDRPPIQRLGLGDVPWS